MNKVPPPKKKEENENQKRRDMLADLTAEISCLLD